MSNADKEESRPSLVLIDDDELVRSTWSLMAQRKGHTLQAFESFEDFQEAGIRNEVPIYVDYQLEGPLNGLNVLTRLHELGYQELYLCTGYPVDPSDVDVPLKGIVKKNYPL